MKYILVYESSYQPVQLPIDLEDFRGDVSIIVGGTPPRHSGSSGYVNVKDGIHVRECYPSVFGLKWLTEREYLETVEGA